MQKRLTENVKINSTLKFLKLILGIDNFQWHFALKSNQTLVQNGFWKSK